MAKIVFHCRLDYHEECDFKAVEVDTLDAAVVALGREAARAAEKYVEGYDPPAAEYPPERDVLVRHPDGREEWYTVECIPVPEYYARPKKGAKS